MHSVHPLAFALVTIFALGCNAHLLGDFTKRQIAEEQCATQCNAWAANFDAVQKCGAPTGPPSQAALDCLCKPALFSSFKDCGQCLLDAEPTLDSYCQTEIIGTNLNEIAVICTNAGVKTDLISFVTPPGFKPEDCQNPGNSSPSGSAPASRPPVPTGRASSSGASQPSPSPLSPIPSIPGSRPSAPPANVSESGSRGASSPGPSATQIGSGSGNGEGQTVLSWLSLIILVVTGIIISA